MKSLIYIFAINFIVLFYCIISLLGINYLGAGDSSLYTSSCVLLNLAALSFFIKDMFCKNIQITNKLLYMFGGQILLLLAYFMEAPAHKVAQNQLLQIFALSMPLCYIAYDISNTRFWGNLTKWIDCIGLLITAGIAISMPSILVTRNYADMDVENKLVSINYQSASYYIAFAYAINLTLISFGTVVKDRFRIFKTKSYSITSIFILALQIALCLMSGGRGGAVLLFISTVVILIVGDRKYIQKVFVKIFFILALGLFSLSIIFPSILTKVDDIISISTERTFSYISGGKIDMSKTSYRDLEYGAAISCIEKSPIVGHGFFRYMQVKNYSSYPHNIVLEILLQGGILYLIIAIIFIFNMYKKFLRIVKSNKSNILLLPFILYPATMLLFSGSYLTTPLFWFVLIYVYTYSFDNNTKIADSQKQ